jgi:hypothetical protein
MTQREHSELKARAHRWEQRCDKYNKRRKLLERQVREEERKLALVRTHLNALYEELEAEEVVV